MKGNRTKIPKVCFRQKGRVSVAKKKKKKFTPAQQKYQAFAKKREPGRPVFSNCVRAFLVGGIISTVGQGFQLLFTSVFDFTETSAANPTVAVLIIIASL